MESRTYINLQDKEFVDENASPSCSDSKSGSDKECISDDGDIFYETMVTNFPDVNVEIGDLKFHLDHKGSDKQLNFNTKNVFGDNYPFSSIDYNIARYIFQFFDNKTRKIGTQVNKSWYQVIYEEFNEAVDWTLLSLSEFSEMEILQWQKKAENFFQASQKVIWLNLVKSEGYAVSALKISDAIKDYFGQIRAFMLLGDIHFKRYKSYPLVAYYQRYRSITCAVGLYNHALNVFNKHNLPETNELNKLIIYKKITLLEVDFLTSIKKEKQVNIDEDDSLYQQSSAKFYQKALKKTRLYAQKQLIEIEQLSDQKEIVNRTKELYRIINKDRKDLIVHLIKDCMQIIGFPPSGCEYAFIGLGSLARMESTPYSDLEFAILINEENEVFKDYFRNLITLMHLKVINIGETQLRMLAMGSLEWLYNRFQDETINGFTFDGAKPWGCKTPLGWQDDPVGKRNFELIHTPEKMANFQLLHFDESELVHLPSILSQTIIIMHSHAGLRLYSKYVKEVKSNLNTPVDQLLEIPLTQSKTVRQIRAINLLRKDIEKFNLKILHKEEEGKLHKIKFDLYRLPSVIFDNLALYFGVEETDFYSKIVELNNKLKGCLNVDGLLQVFSLILRIRLATYFRNNGQDERLWIKIDKNVEDTLKNHFAISDLNSLFLIYRNFIPLQYAIYDFIETEQEVSFKKSYFNDTDGILDALIYCRFLQYENAKKCLEKAAESQPKNRLIWNILASVKFSLGEYIESYDIFYDSLCHIKKLSGDKIYPHITNLLNNLGILSRLTKCDYKAAEAYHTEALAIIKGAAGGIYSHDDLADSNIYLGILYFNLCKYKEAEFHYEEALKIKKILFPYELHPSIADLYESLGLLAQKRCQYHQARIYYKQALAIRKHFYGDTCHPAIANLFNNLGTLDYAFGEFQKAQKNYEYAFRQYRELNLYNADPGLADVLNNLANIYEVLGDLEKSKVYHFQALKLFKQTYCQIEHVDIVDSLYNLGIHSRLCGEFFQAKEYQEQVLEIRQRLYPNLLHTDLVNSFNELGNINSKLGELNKAKLYYRQALDIVKEIYKEMIHVEEAIILNNLGSVCLSMDEEYEAEKYFKQAIKVFLEVYQNKPHVNLLSIFSDLGKLARWKGNYKSSKLFFEKGYTMSCVLYGGKNHPQIANFLNDLGITNELLKDYEQAEKYHEKALIMRKNLYLNDIHPEIAASLNNLGNIKILQGKISQALNYQEKALEIKILLYNDKPHKEIADSLNNFGGICYSLKQYEKAKHYFTLALDKYRILYDTEWRIDIAEVLYNLGVVNKWLGCYKEAKEFYQQTLAIQKKLYHNDNHIEMFDTLCGLGNLYIILNRFQHALAYFEQALIISPEDSIAYYNLGRYYNLQAIINNDEELFKKAEFNFKNALRVDKKIDICTEYANFLIKLNRFQEAEEYLINIINTSLEDDEEFICYKSEKSILPIELQNELKYENLIILSSYSYAFYLLITIYKDNNDIDRAKELIIQFKKIVNSTDYYLNYSLLGYAYKSLNILNEAANCFAQAMQLKNDYFLASQNSTECMQLIETPQFLK